MRVNGTTPCECFDFETRYRNRSMANAEALSETAQRSTSRRRKQRHSSFRSRSFDRLQVRRHRLFDTKDASVSLASLRNLNEQHTAVRSQPSIRPFRSVVGRHASDPAAEGSACSDRGESDRSSDRWRRVHDLDGGAGDALIPRRPSMQADTGYRSLAYDFIGFCSRSAWRRDADAPHAAEYSDHRAAPVRVRAERISEKADS